LYDVHGNVHEWCIDWYDANYYKTSSKEDPQGPATGVKRVMRGGMFSNYPVYCRSANRADALPNKSDTGYGFRVLLIPSG
jgi:formylglycine-generating enzyme